MKMEIPVVAPQDGTVASIDVAEGASVESEQYSGYYERIRQEVIKCHM